MAGGKIKLKKKECLVQDHTNPRTRAFFKIKNKMLYSKKQQKDFELFSRAYAFLSEFIHGNYELPADEIIRTNKKAWKIVNYINKRNALFNPQDMLTEIAYINKKGFMRIDYVRFKNKKECEKVIKEKCPTAEIIWSTPNKVFVTEQYAKK